jgi:Ankyrin repeats (many copies)
MGTRRSAVYSVHGTEATDALALRERDALRRQRHHSSDALSGAMSKPMSGGGGDRRQQFLTAVKNQARGHRKSHMGCGQTLCSCPSLPLSPPQKLDAVRWALTYGGQSVSTRDDDGYTAIHLAAAHNKPKALQLMLDVCRRSRELELIDLRDGAVRAAADLRDCFYALGDPALYIVPQNSAHLHRTLSSLSPPVLSALGGCF